MPYYNKVLLPETTITTALTGFVPVDPIMLGQFPDTAKYLGLMAKFTYGSAGTTCKAWVQTSLDGGTTWVDIANFAFTTTSATKYSALTTFVALAAATTGTDGSLADNTILNGLLGDRLRVKLTTTGTYATSTTLTISVIER